MAFQQGLSGLNATSKELSVIGNNIANVGTYGAKGSRAEFADLYASAIGGGGTSTVGIGVTVAEISQQFSQGNITATQSPLDLAINGNGFFQLDAGGTNVYSRNGQFQLDRNGFITNASGQKLLGYAAADDGTVIPSTVQALQLPTSGISPSATTRVALELNLDSRRATTTPAAPPLIVFNDPTTYNNATSVTVFDAKGQEIAVTYYFQKTAADTWDVYATANGTSVSVDGSGNPQAVVSGMTFSADGSTLTTPTSIAMDIPAVALSSGSSSLAMTGVILNLSGATQYGSAFSVTNLSQDGYAPGLLSGVSIDTTGIIKAQYTNGLSKNAGQLVLARFRNAQGLQPLGGNAWAQTTASGDAIVGAAGTGNFGALQAGALEESNVDLTNELVAMITAQRAYQANAQTIKAEDQMMQTLVNLR